MKAKAGNSQIRVVLVEPKYQLNLGYVARVMKNFGIGQLYIVNPRCKVIGRRSIQYAKHGRDVLESAKIVSSLGKAISGVALGSTGVWRKSDSSFHKVITLASLRRRPALMSGKVSLIIGRDDSGLNRKEMSECDAVLFIETDEKYPVLNISHALAIMLYELTLGRARYDFGKYAAGEKSMKALATLFRKRIDADGYVRDKRLVSAAFARMLKRSAPTNEEVNALMAAFSAKR